MSIPAVNTSTRSSSARDDVVVAAPYAGLVGRVLAQWDAGSAEVESDSRLQLSLLELDSSTAVAALQRDHAELFAAANDEVGPGEGTTPLDQLLRCLREHFRRSYGGWVPTIGKNRVVERLRGSYVIGIGGGGDMARVQGVPAARADGRRTARVGIVDTALFPHPWLAGAYTAASSELLTNCADPDPALSHATFVAGLVLQQAPGAELRVLAGLNEHASSDSWSVARRIADLADDGVDVVNLSFGCTTEDNRPPLVLSAALATLPQQTVVVAAAGNHGKPGTTPAPVFPAALDDVIAVGALNGSQLADFSPDARWVDAVAPGVDVTSTCHPGGGDPNAFGRWSGTSFAAAVVAGAIAAEVAPGRTSRQVWDRMRQRAGGKQVHVALRDDPNWVLA